MTRFSDEERVDISSQMRRHLAVIQAHSELLLETASTDQEQEGLASIHRSTLELGSLVSPQDNTIKPFSDDVANNSVGRVLVCSQSEYLTRTLDSIPTAYGNIDLLQATNSEEAASILADSDIDRLLVDTIWPTGTGVDVIGDLVNRRSVPPYALVSIATDTRTPAILALSGVCSPTISAAQLDRIFSEYVEDTDSMAVAGLFSDDPGGAVSEHVSNHPDTIVDDPSDVTASTTPGEVSADAVCIDAAVYRSLSAAAITNLRMVAPGRGRPLILVAATDNDPSDRAWIPTLGSREFLHRPVTVSGLLAALFNEQTQ